MSYQALLFCPDERTARVVTQVLSELEFKIELCAEPFAAVKKLMAQHFDAIVVDCENEQNATLLFKSARNSGSNQSSLSVAVVEGQAGVAKAFRIGANLVLTKPINVEQSKGTLRVARGLLRKAETGKPGGLTSPATGPHPVPVDASANSGHQLTPPGRVQKSSPPSLPVRQPPTQSPAARSSAFELDAEPAPQPDAAEAALLENMSDSAPAASSTPPPFASSSAAKEYPWQPVSKPLSEPMASALRRAAETAGKPPATVPSARVAPTKGKENLSSGISSGLGAATAPAPAREAPQPRVKSFESSPVAAAAPAPKKQYESISEPAVAKTPTAVADEGPTFASLDDARDQQASDAGGSQKKFLIAAVALVLVAAGYFGWTKMHHASGPPNGQQQVAPAATPATRPSETSPDQPAAGLTGTHSDTASSEVSEVSFQPSQEVTATSSVKTAGSKPSAAIPAAAPQTKTAAADQKAAAADQKTAAADQAPEPIVVRNDHSKPASAATEAEQAPSPEAIAVASNTGDKAISGIMSATPVNLPKPVPQTVKISQGVSQGLLIKRIAPTYPAQAKQLRVQGAVQIQANIGKDGSITNVKLLNGDAMLGRAAMDAVRQWKYKPYVLNGEPIEIQTQVTVIFKLP